MAHQLLRPRANRIIVIIFLALCLIIIVTSRLPVDHPARIRLRNALTSTYDLRVPWADGGPGAALYSGSTPHDHSDHSMGMPKVISIGADPRTAHNYRDDGLVEVNSHGPHPIYELVKQAEKDWKAKNTKASKTLPQAVLEYKRRYGRPPPTGFDVWWQYTQDHKVLLPDEFDRIHHDIEPFWGVDATTLSSNQAAREHENGTFTITCQSGILSLDTTFISPSDHKALDRARGQLEILLEVEKWLPDFRATFQATDVPSQLIPHSLKKAAIDAAHEHQGTESSSSEGTSGWAAACPPSSSLTQKRAQRLPDPTEFWAPAAKTFVSDHQRAMDPCQHPKHVFLNGLLQQLSPPTFKNELVPSFSVCTTKLHSDVLAVPTEDWVETIPQDPQWAQKPHKKLYWRGNNTGAWYSDHTWWNLTQRVRFISTSIDEFAEEVYVLPSTATKYEPVGMGERMEKSLLNDWVDARFTGQPMQCESESGFCERLGRDFEFVDREPTEYEKQWRYLMDVDGNACSSRFKRLLTSRGTVLKATIHPEWYTDRIQPWVHYVPVKYDFTDLYDILTFFNGDAHGQGGAGHDDIAAAIGAAGRKWSLTHWRREDMVAYMFRLMLEYARVMNPARTTLSFDPETAREEMA